MPIKGVNISHLWDGSVIRLPRALCEQYERMLVKLGFLEAARVGTRGAGPTGGLSVEETNEHFTHRFGVGGSRIQYVVVAGNTDLQNVASDLFSSISDGAVRLLDIPCGAGPSSATFISLIADMRTKKIIPSTPLNLSVFGGDCSPQARLLFDDLYRGLIPEWEAQGIKTRAVSVGWDATAGDSTAALMDLVLDERQEKPDEYVVLITNFSGEASNPVFFSEFSPCLEQILARLSTKRCTVVWLEPTMSGSRDLLGSLLKFLPRRIRWVEEEIGTTDVDVAYRMAHPIKGDIHKCTVKLLRHFRR